MTPESHKFWGGVHRLFPHGEFEGNIYLTTYRPEYPFACMN